MLHGLTRLDTELCEVANASTVCTSRSHAWLRRIRRRRHCGGWGGKGGGRRQCILVITIAYQVFLFGDAFGNIGRTELVLFGNSLDSRL